MKTLVTLFKIAMLVTTVSFVMSCDKNNKKTNNTGVNAGIYTYGANGICINNQTGQQMPVTYCQNQYNNGGYGSQSCNGNPNLYIFIRGNQSLCQYDYTGQQMQVYNSSGGCWISCANQYGISCSGQQAYPGNTGQYMQSQPLPVQCL